MIGKATFSLSVGGNQCLTFAGIVGNRVLGDSQDSTATATGALQLPTDFRL